MISLRIQCQRLFEETLQDAVPLLKERLEFITSLDTEVLVQTASSTSTAFNLEFTGDLPELPVRNNMQYYAWGFLEGMLLVPKEKKPSE